MYTPMPYGDMTLEQHNIALKALIRDLVGYLDGDSFKLFALGLENDYFLKLIDDLKKGGAFGGRA